jgi:hypothetical protein
MEDRSSRRVRTLVTRKARRGLSANEIACALISMMARSTCSNQRPNTLMQDRISQRRPKPLAPHGRTIHSGQTEKNSARANVFRVTPESGHCSIRSACLKGVKLGSGPFRSTRRKFLAMRSRLP